MSDIKAKIKATAQNFLGGRKLFEHQDQACAALLSGRDVMLVAPMGSGKSLCYQLPTHLSTKPTLVISPLIALMDDQVKKTRSLGLDAAVLHGGIEAYEQWRTISKWMAGTLRVLYTSPERLCDPRLRQCFGVMRPGLIVVDEAHCISTWGSRFRPAYRQLGQMCKAFGPVPLLAMTASAKPAVQLEIVRSLDLCNPVLISAPFVFANLELRAEAVKNGKDRLGILLNLTAHPSSLPLVVFCLTRKQCDWVSAFLLQSGRRVLKYHAGMTRLERSHVTETFRESTSDILVATSAYELGIDKNNIRTVVHLGLPSSLESYVQGVGRAGRDGDEASAILLYDEHDLDVIDAVAGHRHENDNSLDEMASAAAEVYAFAQTKGCRVGFLNGHFFPKVAEEIEACGNCDRCRLRNKPKDSCVEESPKHMRAIAALKEWRRKASKERKQKSFKILTDREMHRLCIACPQSEAHLYEVGGVRRSVIENDGREILRIIRASSTFYAQKFYRDRPH